MRRAGRIVLRCGAGAITLLAALTFACLDGIDYRPFFRTPYFEQTVGRMQRSKTNHLVVFGDLQAGFGRAMLTPTFNAEADDPAQGRFRAIPLAGYGDRKGKAATSVHDDVFVKAVALRVADRTAVIVGADALIIPREVADMATARLAQELGLRREQIYLGATHTHSSLGGWGEGMVGEAFAGGFQPGVRVWFADRIVAAARQALGDLTPAAFGDGSFKAPQFVRNRLVGQFGRTDPELSFAVLRQNDGDTAVVGAYAAHATVLSGGNLEFSGDYPGAWQRAIEETTHGLALFLAGGVGSHSPVPGKGGFEGAETMGHALAEPVLSGLAQLPLTNRVAFGVDGVEADLPTLHVRLTDGLRLRPWLAKRLLPVTGRSFVQVLRLGNMLWISTPCDFSGELALGLKDAFRPLNAKAVVTSFNGDYIGYVIPSRYYHLAGYEPRLMSFFGPTVPDYLEELIRRLGQELLATPLDATRDEGL